MEKYRSERSNWTGLAFDVDLQNEREFCFYGIRIWIFKKRKSTDDVGFI